LNRFLFDYDVMDRIKVNDNFAFSLEFNSKDYQENPNEDPLENEYELSAVILHRGDGYNGHYQAYIRDVINEGNWDDLIKIFDDNKEILKRKTIAETEMKKDSTKIEENLNKMELESKKKSEEIIEEKNNVIPEKNNKNHEIPFEKNNEIHLEKNNEIHLENEKNPNENKKKKGVKKQKKEGKGKKKPEKADKNKKKDEKKVEYLKDEFFDELEFPIPFKNPDLAKNWFDFNDCSVNAIPVNRLQKQYGGSNENAYLLIYRQINLSKKHEEDPFVRPDYLEKCIKIQNEVLEKERMAYRDAEKHIELFILNSNDINV